MITNKRIKHTCPKFNGMGEKFLSEELNKPRDTFRLV